MLIITYKVYYVAPLYPKPTAPLYSKKATQMIVLPDFCPQAKSREEKEEQ
jgi:hypothetical protein